MKRQLSVIMILLLTNFIGFAIIIPVLPVVLEYTGKANTHLAWMLALYSAVSFVMSPIWGAWSDRIGRRPIIMTGMLGFSFSFLLFGLAGEQLWLMYISRLIGGMFSGAVTSCAVAYVADITSDEERTNGMGLVGMSIGLGFVIGPAVGGLLSYWGHNVPFFASSALALMGWAFAVKWLPESRRPAPAGGAGQAGGVKVSRWRAFQGVLKYLYVLSFLVSFTLAGLESVFQLFQQDKIGLDSVGAGFMFLVNGIVGAFIQGYVVRKRIKKGMETASVLVGLLLSAAGFFLILLSQNWWTATLYMCIFGAGNALIRPCVTSLITQKTSVSQGIATGLMSSMDSLGRIMGPLLMGAVLFDWSPALPFVAGGALCLAALGLLGRFHLLVNRQEKLEM